MSARAALPVIFSHRLSMQTLVDFLNHGVLPFTGRAVERERIMAFWRTTVEAQWMRAALLVGEAGVGKSRLIEEITSPIAAAGGVVIAAKLYPESAMSVAPVLAQALWYADGTRRLLKSEPEPTMNAVTAALRRVSRLRPTLLVIEDIHLLSGDALAEFALLFESLADEILSVLCAARPVELEARGILERYLTEEIELEGLPAEQIAELWRRVFETEGTADVVGPLAEATHGNPLALRSALRGALRGDALVRDDPAGGWRLKIPAGAFARSLQRSVGFLADGMAAHLSREEKPAAVRLAMLGEVFAKEAADAMIPDTDRLLDQLTFKGVVVTARVAAPPLDNAASEFPLYAFTHTLLHRHLVEGAAVPLGDLLAIVADGLPLYSVLPFQLMPAAVDAGEGGEAFLLRRAIDRAVAVSAALDRGPDWKLAMEIWNVAALLVERTAAVWSPADRMDLHATLLVQKIALHRRGDLTAEYEAMVNELLAVTETMMGEGERAPLRHRLSALRLLHWRMFREDYSRCRAVWEEVQTLLARAPELAASSEHVEYLRDVAQAAAATPDEDMLRRVESTLRSVLASGALDEEHGARARRRVVPHLLPLFETEAELQERLAMLDELAASTVGNDTDFKVWKLTLLESIGRMDEALAVCDDLHAQSQRLGLARTTFHSRLVRLCAYAAFGMEMEGVLETAQTLCAEAPEESRASVRGTVAIYLSTIGLLRGEPEWTLSMMGHFGGSVESLWPEKQVLLAIAAGAPEAAAHALVPGDTIGDNLLPALLFAASMEGADVDVAEEAWRELFSKPLLRLENLVPLHAGLALLDLARAHTPAVAERLAPRVRAVLTEALSWLADRSLAAYMRPLLRRHERYLTKREGEGWRARAAAIERERAGNRQWRTEQGRLAVSMLGTITTQTPGNEPERLRGPRLCAVLGLLVANEMLDEPLDHRDFCRLASGGEMDPELARKTTNQAVVRLREVLAPDAIITGEETHVLNVNSVTVDLLEAHRLLDEAAAAERERALMRAVPAVLRALDLAAGEVPFPGLYDDFFEAIRSDFETRLRDAVIGVAGGLLREDDAATAERVLRRAFEAMPEDEDLSDLLCNALNALGKRTEAERVRMQARAAMESE